MARACTDKYAVRQLIRELERIIRFSYGVPPSKCNEMLADSLQTMLREQKLGQAIKRIKSSSDDKVITLLQAAVKTTHRKRYDENYTSKPFNIEEVDEEPVWCGNQHNLIPLEIIIRREIRADIERAIRAVSRYNPRGAQIIQGIDLDGRTQRMLANELLISQQRVFQCRNVALRQLAEELLRIGVTAEDMAAFKRAPAASRDSNRRRIQHLFVMRLLGALAFCIMAKGVPKKYQSAAASVSNISDAWSDKKNRKKMALVLRRRWPEKKEHALVGWFLLHPKYIADLLAIASETSVTSSKADTFIYWALENRPELVKKLVEALQS